MAYRLRVCQVGLECQQPDDAGGPVSSSRRVKKIRRPRVVRERPAVVRERRTALEQAGVSIQRLATTARVNYRFAWGWVEDQRTSANVARAFLKLTTDGRGLVVVDGGRS